VKSSFVVKVTLPETSTTGELLPTASVVDETGAFRMLVSAGLVSRRFRPRERVAYFKLVVRGQSKGAFDLGDRVPDPGW
jgi:hypothetical protein